ncbi:MAG TPA: type II secretion system F family protein [Alphaproteobacteria bacterium]|nr:type II secretion system F family protein [Alphaproteobacteria bacterium]
MNLAHLFSLGITADEALVASAAGTVVLVMLTVWQALTMRDPVNKRVRALSKRRAALKADSLAAAGHSMRGDLRQSGYTFIRRLVLKFNLARGRQVEIVSARLARAGYRSKDALAVFIFAKTVAPFLFGGGALLFFGLSGHAATAPTLRLLAVAIGGVAGLFGPDIYVSNEGSKRIQRMSKGLPDALDLLVICAEAGLSLDASIARIGSEMAEAAPELAEEFALTSIELGFLPDRHTALQNLTRRTDMQKLRSLVNSLIQTERYGTPLATSLRVLAAEFREERLMRAEEKAARLPATMTVPMIVFILPALFIVLGGPVAIRIMDMTSKM